MPEYPFWNIVNELTIMLLAADTGDDCTNYVGYELLNSTP
jgi:hypothetical protein